jgi:hypothetical protein
LVIRGGIVLGHPRVDPTAPILIYGGAIRQGETVLTDPDRELERWLLRVVQGRVAAPFRAIVETTLRGI